MSLGFSPLALRSNTRTRPVSVLVCTDRWRLLPSRFLICSHKSISSCVYAPPCRLEEVPIFFSFLSLVICMARHLFLAVELGKTPIFFYIEVRQVLAISRCIQILEPISNNKVNSITERMVSFIHEVIVGVRFNHQHSGIKFVMPEQRHTGENIQILAKRKTVYEKEKLKIRFAGQVRPKTGIG